MGHPSTSWSTGELLRETDWMRGLALHLAGGEDADDLVQDAVVAALEQRPRTDRPLRPWLGQVLRKRLAFLRRSRGRRQSRETVRARVGADEPVDQLLERAELHGRVVQAVMELGEPTRSVLLLHYFGGLSLAEIAQRRAIPAATVRGQLRRGLQGLRERLARDHEGDERDLLAALLALARPSAAPSPDTHPIPGRKAMTPSTQLWISASGLLLLSGLARFSGLLSPSSEDADALGAAQRSSTSAPAAPEPLQQRTALALPGSELGANAAEAIVSGTLHDVSGAPLALYALELSHASAGNAEQWSEPELLSTDASGRFRSEHSYSAGWIRLRWIDHPDQRQIAFFARQVLSWSEGTSISREWTAEQGELELRAPAGPCFELELALPEGRTLEELEAWLEPLSPSTVSFVAVAPLRATDTTWVRFGPLQPRPPAAEPWRLRVQSHDGLVAGELPVHLVPDAPAQHVALTLEPSARLDLDLLVTEELRQPSVTLEEVATGERRLMIPGPAHDLEGQHALTFQRAGARPGSYRALVSTADYDFDAGGLELVAGQTLTHQLDWTQAAAETLVRGELRSQSGTYHAATQLVVLDADGAVLRMEPAHWTQQDGQWVAPFALENLPAAALELQLASNDTHRRWLGLPLVFTPPQQGLVLVCDDGEPVQALWIRVLDASTGAKIPRSWGAVSLAGCEEALLTTAVPGTSIHPALPLAALREWYAAAEGYAPRWGASEGIVQEGDHLLAEVRLERGWGARIRCVRAGTLPAEPLAGVQVLLDGEPAGLSDAQGELVLQRATSPGTVSVAIEDWTYAGGDLDPQTGRLADDRPWEVLRFEQ